MKAVASRPDDWADLNTLLDIHPRVDRRRIRRWARRFADAMNAPEIIENIGRLLAPKRALQPRKKKRRRRD